MSPLGRRKGAAGELQEPPPCGFEQGGRRYTVRDVDLLDAADTDLWNDRMRVQIDHRGRVLEAGFQQPNWTTYSEPLRCFYIKDEETGRYWSAPHEPVCAAPDDFEFSAGTVDVRWRTTVDGIRVDLCLLVPRRDEVELWSLTATNVSDRPRRLSVYSYMPVGRLALLCQEALYDPALRAALHTFFPYYVHHEDYPGLSKLRNLVFCAADARPVGCELSVEEFVGRGDLSRPDALASSRLPRPPARYEVANERTTNVFQFRRRLAPGGSRRLRFVFGPAGDRAHAARLARKYLAPGGFERACKAVASFETRYAPSVRVETPDPDFNHFINHWQSRRSLMLARTLRFNLAPQGRNVIQDAMGSVYTDPASGRAWFLRIWAHQRADGWLPHGMPFAEGVRQIEINRIPHKDINVWGPAALSFYAAETGDFAILDERVPFADRPGRSATLYEHVCLGLEWLLRDRTRRGLSRIGQGDWNDPLNMAGLSERGESVWLSEALVLALETWAEVAERRGEIDRARGYRRQADRSRRAVNRLAWDGRWYVRGFTDAGRAFGSRRNREGRIYLNAQSWAVMAGLARGDRAAACLDAAEELLMTPSGPMTLWPAYTGMREDIGKLTQKTPGWNENGSVYCHAATFYAYALYAARRADAAFRVLRGLLPGWGGNSIARSGQLPLYVPNFYRGRDAGRHAGRSSRAPNTGTASWYYRTAVAMLLGIRAEFGGLRIDPQLPSHWREARVWRRWRGAAFDIGMARADDVTGLRVFLDGMPLPGNLVPVQPARSRHRVRVVIGHEAGR